MQTPNHRAVAASVNGVVIAAGDILEESRLHEDAPDALGTACRALAIRELLRQRAIELDMLARDAALDDDTVDGLLAREMSVPTPTRDDCLRYYEAHRGNFQRNAIVYASHILFAVTGGVALVPVRQKAETTLQRLLTEPGAFEEAAASMSNCPSGGVGGSLGQLTRGDSVPEFERALFDSEETGLLPRLVKTRFGFHIVRIDRRVPGEPVPFESAWPDIARFLAERVRHKAIQQYIAILASRAKLAGVQLGEANGPLVQ